MRETVAVLVLLLLTAAVAWLRPLPGRAAPAALPAADCVGWMADAIPGVGPKRRDEVAAGIRAGAIPAAAEGWFSRAAH